MNFNTSGFPERHNPDGKKNYFRIIAVSKGKDEDVMGIFNRTKAAIQHLNRPDLLKSFVEDFKRGIKQTLSHYTYYDKFDQDYINKNIDEAYS